MNLLFSQCLSSDFNSPGLYHHHLVVVGLYIALRWFACHILLFFSSFKLVSASHECLTPAVRDPSHSDSPEVYLQIILRFSIFCYN